MDIIDGLLKEFKTGADRIESSLSSMLTLVSGGRVPPKSDILALEQELDELQSAYASIQRLASEVVSKEEMPVAGASVSDYADAIKKSEVLRIKEQLAEIETRLRRFISVKSLVTAFEDALKPYQAAAQDILSQLDREAVPSPNELEKATEAHKLFLEAIATEDFDSDAGMDLLEKLEEHYPSKVQRGLMLNKYYIEEDIGATEAAAKESMEPLSDQTASAEVVAEVPEEASEPPEIIRANAKIKEKAPSANTFKKEILKISPEVHTILPLFTNLGALTADQVYAFGCCMDCFEIGEDTKERVQKALDTLVAKSAVASYTLNSLDEIVYCLTAFGYESLMKRSISIDMKHTFNVSFGKYRLIGKDEMTVDSLEYPLLHNSLLMLYFGRMKKRLQDGVYELTKQSIFWDGAHYTISVFADDSPPYKCFVTIPDDDYAALLKKGNILIYAEDIHTIEVPNDSGNKIFAHDGSSVYLWDGAWVEQTTAYRSDDAKEENGGATDTISEHPAAEDEPHEETADPVEISDINTDTTAPVTEVTRAVIAERNPILAEDPIEAAPEESISPLPSPSPAPDRAGSFL